MVQVILSKEQALQLERACEAVELLDPEGRSLGIVTTRLTAAQIEAGQKLARSDGPWYSTAEVLQHLESLE
jgi:hypothetical protein